MQPSIKPAANTDKEEDGKRNMSCRIRGTQLVIHNPVVAMMMR